ncbi:MAG TPA: hypothetical protein VI197_03050 [Polyangiaceae bacterium]
MKRREFMAGALGTAGGVVAAGSVAGSLLTAGCKQPDRSTRQQQTREPAVPAAYAKRVTGIRSRLSGLTLDSQEIVKFVQAWETRKGPLKGKAVKLAELFLLSSDFFQTGENAKRAPKFFMIYDPYLSPCYNPLRDLKT